MTDEFYSHMLTISNLIDKRGEDAWVQMKENLNFDIGD